MGKKVKMLLFKIQRSKAAHLLVPLLWVPIHTLIFNRLFNKKNLNASYDTTYKFFESTIESESFVQEIKAHIKTIGFLEQAKKEMIASPGLESYSKDIYPELPLRLRALAYIMALNDTDVRESVSKYFGFMPRLHDLSILYNVPIEGSFEEGSKLWHRDVGDCDFKNMKVFMPITDISKKNGPFFFLADKKQAMHHNVLSPDQASKNPWLAGRVSNDAVSSLSSEVRSNINATGGQRLLIDTVNTYHKGGFCASEDRLMLQISYQGDGYNGSVPMEFSEEIHYIQKHNVCLNEKEIKREAEARERYCKKSRLALVLRFIVFKLGILFVCRR